MGRIGKMETIMNIAVTGKPWEWNGWGYIQGDELIE